MDTLQSRKAQIALFVVVGIVLVIIVTLYLVLRKAPEVKTDAVPSEFSAVQEHVQSCLHDTLVDGLKIMASHGGYLDPQDRGEMERGLRLNPLDPTESDLVLLNPTGNDSAVPYYLYLVSPNACQDCFLTTLTPTKEHMEQAAEYYVLTHLPECVNYGIFSDIDVTPKGKPTIYITFSNESVFLHYEQTIEMRRGESTVVMKTFAQRLDLPFLTYYNMARQITQQEIDTQFLENYLLYLVSANSGLNAPLPPLGGYEESFSPKMWIMINVQQYYQQYVQSVTPSLQVYDTKGVTEPPATGDPYVDGFLRMTYLDLLGNSGIDASEYRVSIYSPNAPVYLNVNPHKGQLIRPESQRQGSIPFLPPRQRNYYDFFYDVSVPFIFEIRHENALPNTDFSFLFAIEANVRENKNMAQWMLGHGTIPWSKDFVDYKINDPVAGMPPDTPINFSGFPPANASDAMPDNSSMRYQHNTSLHTLLCDRTQQTSHLNVRVTDRKTQQPLPDVIFSMMCGYYSSCGIGTSQITNVYSELDADVPPCTGAYLKAEKEGYNTFMMPVTTQPGRRQQIPDFSLDPFITKNVRVVKYLLKRNLTTDQVMLDRIALFNVSKETLLVTFVRHAQTDGEGAVTAAAMFSNDTSLTEVSLVPGLYEIRAIYLNNDGYIIRKGCRVIEGQLIPANDTEIKPAPWGGLELTNETFLWLVQPNELYSDKDLVIPVFVAPPPRCIDDLESMGETKLYTQMFRTEATPRFE